MSALDGVLRLHGMWGLPPGSRLWVSRAADVASVVAMALGRVVLGSVAGLTAVGAVGYGLERRRLATGSGAA